MKTNDKSTQDAISRGSSQWRATPTRPLDFKVIIEIDERISVDVASMDFIEQAIIRVFAIQGVQLDKLREQFTQHKRAECGKFSREIAETKQAEFIELANDNEHKLECFIEVSE